ncbi:MAG: hypothetical protein WDW36_006396 [Sanguina aurantia]
MYASSKGSGSHLTFLLSTSTHRSFRTNAVLSETEHVEGSSGGHSSQQPAAGERSSACGPHSSRRGLSGATFKLPAFPHLSLHTARHQEWLRTGLSQRHSSHRCQDRTRTGSHAGFATSAPSSGPTPATDESPLAADSPGAPAGQAHPPGSERWRRWMDVLRAVPQVTAEEAREILVERPQLLARDPEAAAVHLSHLRELLAFEAGVHETDFATLVKSQPLVFDISIVHAGEVFDWFKRTGQFGVQELNRVARYTPEVLFYSIDTLRSRLQSLLDLGLGSAERACLCIIHTPRLLTLDPPDLQQRLDGLCAAFGCSRRYILQSSAHALERNLDRLLVRAALLRHLDSGGRVSIGDVRAAVSDEAFADAAVGAHVKRSGRPLSELCAELQRLPGMAAAAAAAGLPGEISTPLQCLQAFYVLWKAQPR